MKKNTMMNTSNQISDWAKRLLLCLLLPCIGVYAESWQGHTHYEYSGPWKWTESNCRTIQTSTGFKELCDATITGYTGSSADLSIPEKITMHTTVTVNGDTVVSWEYEATVKSIGSIAFHEKSGLTSVTIPNSVTSIGDYAFSGCSGLTSVHINDLAKWCGITFGSWDSNPLYYAHNLYLNGVLVDDLVIPDSVTSIGNYAFSGCIGLTSVTIPNSVTSIGSAFYGCSGLTSVTIPNSVTSIGDCAFYNCSGLTSVTIPNSVTSIGGGAFSGCSGLTGVTIPNGVTNIGNSAFYNCSGLTGVTIGNGVTNIGN